MDYQKVLEDIYTEVKPYRRAGHQADYIPALERVNPDQFGMSLTTVDGRSFHVAESEVRFSIQSISKVYSLALCLSLRGEKLWERVGKEPSGNAFNSIVQLEYEDGIPRNPFINAGALVTADILVSCLEYPRATSCALSVRWRVMTVLERIRRWLRASILPPISTSR